MLVRRDAAPQTEADSAGNTVDEAARNNKEWMSLPGNTTHQGVTQATPYITQHTRA